MSQKIPGGRQRASSEGDILDEDDEFADSGQSLNVSHRQVSKSVFFSSDTPSSSNDNGWEKNEHPLAPSERKKKSRKLSFKSVKNLMGRVMKNASSSSNVKDQDVNSRATWTPTMRRKNNSAEDEKTVNNNNGWKADREMSGSTSRPLITDPTVCIPRCRWEKTPGTVGLNNHGNTCFMNAVLQCLSNTDFLTEYFVSDMYKRDLRNSKNNKKSGNRDVTEQFGLLLKSLWSNTYSSNVSSDFKNAVGKYNSQYKGSSQHDAQEFLLWLLDRVHEDLTSDSKKKPKPVKNAHTLTDEELVEDALSNSSSSFVSQLFQALHRSSLTCPHCGQHSNTFDPYLCVSLPLPQKCPRAVYINVVYLDSQNSIVRIGLRLNAYDIVKELREAVSTRTQIYPSELILCQIRDDGSRSIFSDEQPLSDIPESEAIYALETYSPQSPSSETSYVQLAIVHVEREHNPTNSYKFCSPMVLRMARDVSCRQLQREIIIRMGSAIKEGVLSQKLTMLFRLRVVDGASDRTYLPNNVEMPLFTEAIDRALSMSGRDAGPPHVMMILEWETHTKNSIVADDVEYIKEDSSVFQVHQSMQQTPSVSLEECLQLYTQEERLSGDDAWLCPHCKKQQQGAIKTLGLWSLPDVLIIHLKRFKQVGLRRNKLNTLVKFPLDNLDMTRHVVQRRKMPAQNGYPGFRLLNGRGDHNPAVKPDDDLMYDLFAVTNHYGNMTGGHYTAYCKSPVDGKWNEFDDTRVRSLPETYITSKAAYILFYQRRSLSKHCNQGLHTGNHWVFRLQYHDAEPNPGSPSSTKSVHFDPSPQISQGAATSQQGRRDASGNQSPRRPILRPLTPQPPRKNVVLQVVDFHDESSVDKRKEFREDSREKSPLRRQYSEQGPQTSVSNGWTDHPTTDSSTTSRTVDLHNGDRTYPKPDPSVAEKSIRQTGGWTGVESSRTGNRDNRTERMEYMDRGKDRAEERGERADARMERTDVRGDRMEGNFDRTDVRRDGFDGRMDRSDARGNRIGGMDRTDERRDRREDELERTRGVREVMDRPDRRPEQIDRRGDRSEAKVNGLKEKVEMFEKLDRKRNNQEVERRDGRRNEASSAEHNRSHVPTGHSFNPVARGQMTRDDMADYEPRGPMASQGQQKYATIARANPQTRVNREHNASGLTMPHSQTDYNIQTLSRTSGVQRGYEPRTVDQRDSISVTSMRSYGNQRDSRDAASVKSFGPAYLDRNFRESPSSHGMARYRPQYHLGAFMAQSRRTVEAPASVLKESSV